MMRLVPRVRDRRERSRGESSLPAAARNRPRRQGRRRTAPLEFASGRSVQHEQVTLGESGGE